MKKTFSAFVLFFFMGCVSNFEKANEESKLSGEKYLNALKTEKTLDPIREHIYFGLISEAPFSYFVNKNYVKESDRKALEKFQSTRALFDSESRIWYQKYSPHTLELWNYLVAARFTIFTDLYNGKITYGEYAVKIKEVVANYNKAKEQRELEIQVHNSQIRSQAINTFITQLNNQQLINSLNSSPARIAPFSCNNYGATISCW
jgi:hypothetical protein